MKVRKNGATFEITGIVDSLVAARFLRGCGFTIVDDLLVRDAQLRIGADDAGHDGCLGEGHSGSSLTCEHPFCVAERMPPS